MNETDAIKERLDALFVECFSIEVPSPDTDLLDTGALDSLQFVELLTQLEQRFGFQVKVSDIDIDDLRTIERIARLIAEQGGTAGRAPRPAASA